MNKSAEQNLSFRERRANFSVRISANGRMGIMPKEAQIIELENTSLKESLGQLYKSRALLHSERQRHPQKSEDWLRIDESLNRVRGQIGNTEKMLQTGKEKHWAVIFHFCAEQLLTHHAYVEIRQAVWEMFGKSQTVKSDAHTLLHQEAK